MRLRWLGQEGEMKERAYYFSWFIIIIIIIIIIIGAPAEDWVVAVCESENEKKIFGNGQNSEI